MESRRNLYETNLVECRSCLFSEVHCTDAYFEHSECCSKSDDFGGKGSLERCMSGWDFCSNGLKNSHLKYLTCPSVGCPEGNHLILLEATEKEGKWEAKMNREMYNCKIKIESKSDH